MKKLLFILAIILLLGNCKTIGHNKTKKGGKIPGLKTMQKFGKKLNSRTILDEISTILQEFGSAGAFNQSLNNSNTEPVFVIEQIEFNRKGHATKIEGHVEVPATYREFIAMGGLGVPVYEAGEPNEFGVIFGREASVAVRDGVIVRINPLENTHFYSLKIGSETYDKISTASILYQAYEAIRTPYLENKLIELEGMLLNSASKDRLLSEVKKFKAEHQDQYKTDAELLINFLKANQSYVKELEKSSAQAKTRMKEGEKLLDLLSSACALQTADIALVFAEMAADLLLIAESALEISSSDSLIGLAAASVEAAARTAILTAKYLAKNIPKDSEIKFKDLQNIHTFNRYNYNQYKKNLRKNRNLWKKTHAIIRQITGYHRISDKAEEAVIQQSADELQKEENEALKESQTENNSNQAGNRSRKNSNEEIDHDDIEDEDDSDEEDKVSIEKE